jgi:hypothetical protein
MIVSMRAGVGFSTREDAAAAVSEAFQAARVASGPPELSLVFTTDAYDCGTVWDTMRRLAPDSPFAGFQTGGIFSRQGVLPQGIGIATVSGDLRVVTHIEPGLDGDPWETGTRAGTAMQQHRLADGLVIMLPDGFPPGIYEATRSLYATLGPAVRYTGGASGDSLKFAKTCQFTEAALMRNALALAAISECRIGTAIGHGWHPHGEPLVITRSQGKRVYEIDGRPAFQVYRESLGIDVPRQGFRAISMVNPFGFVDMSGNYIIRDARAVNDDDSLDFVTEVPDKGVAQLMRGEVDGLVATAREVAARAVAGLRSPQLALAFDCISRNLLMGPEFEREVAAVADGLGPEIPFLGALTFGEIGSFTDVPLFHNKTIAVAAFDDAGSGVADGG